MEERKFTKRMLDLGENKECFTVNNLKKYFMFIESSENLKFIYDNPSGQNKVYKNNELVSMDTVADMVKRISCFKKEWNSDVFNKSLTEYCRQNPVGKAPKRTKSEIETDEFNRIMHFLDTEFSDKLEYNTKTNTVHFTSNGNRLDAADYMELYEHIKSATDAEQITESKFKKIITAFAKKHPYSLSAVKVTDRFDVWDDTKLSSDNYSDYFDYDKAGSIVTSIKNYILYLQYDNVYKNNIKWNDFNEEIYVRDDMYSMWTGYKSKEYDPMLYLNTEIRMDQPGKINRANINDAFLNVAKHHHYHPIKDILDKLPEWDGIPRIYGDDSRKSLFAYYFDADDTRLNKNMAKKWFTAAMKRIYEPGCQFRGMLVFYGSEQGSGKTSFMQYIFGNEIFDENYVNTNLDIFTDDVQLVPNLNKTWVGCFDELAKFKLNEVKKIKNFISNTDNVATLKYDRDATKYKVHSVYYATTNERTFLNDDSSEDGNESRFWVVEVRSGQRQKEWWDEHFDLNTRKQILAEALYYYKTEPDMDLMLDEDDKQALIEVSKPHKISQLNDTENEVLDDLLDSYYEHPYVYETSHLVAENRYWEQTNTYKYQLNLVKCRSLKEAFIKEVGFTKMGDLQFAKMLNQHGFEKVKYMKRDIPQLRGKHCWVRKSWWNNGNPISELNEEDTEVKNELPF